MKSKTILLFLTLFSVSCFSQTEEEVEILKSLIREEVCKGNLYIQCEKNKTYFNAKEFIEQTGLNVPQNALKELAKSATESNNGKWDPEYFNSINTLPFLNPNCLPSEQTNDVIKESGENQTIILISDPIFDSDIKHCVVSVSRRLFPGSAYGHTYFLKKVYGVWVIITVYDVWIT